MCLRAVEESCQRSLFYGRWGGGLTFPLPRVISRLCHYRSGDFVRGGVGNVKGFHLRWPIYDCCQDLGDCGVSSAVVGFRTLCAIPQTDGEGFGSRGGDKRHLVLKPRLLSELGNDFPFYSLGKLSHTIGLEVHIDSACKHVSLLGYGWPRGDSDNFRLLSLLKNPSVS